MTYRIPFNRPAVVGQEFDYIHDAIVRGQMSGDGHYTRLCQALLRRELGSSSVLLTTSCTHALEMAAMLAGTGPGDEVIVPSFTFVSTANAFVLRGARAVFADIRPDTLNLDESSLRALITSRTRAIVAVHYAGVGCEMDAIRGIASEHSITVVEDNAHGLFGTYRGKALGTFGSLAAQSFHETKNISCGEGGAIVINDPQFEERAEVLREKGTNRARFFRGQVEKYNWVDIGSSYVLSDCLAAFLCAQLERRTQIQAARERIWNRYRTALAPWAEAWGIGLPYVPGHCGQAFHMFYLLMPSGEDRDAFIRHLASRGILAVFHYVPLNLAPMGINQGGRPGQCPVAESVAERIVRLPFFYSLTEEDEGEVIRAALEFEPGRTKSIAALALAVDREQSREEVSR